MSYPAQHELIAALRIAVNRDQRRRRRRARVAAAVGALVLLVGGTAWAATNTPWWHDSKPEVAKAGLLVDAALRYPYNGIAAGTRIGLWRAPDRAGGWCLVVARFDGARLQWGPGSHAAQCSQAASASYPPGHPMTVGVDAVLRHGLYDHLVEGSVDPKSGIVKVVLESSGRTTVLAFRHGAFLGDAPPTTTFRVRKTSVVGLDASGHEVARVRLPLG